jgi:cytochrome P450
MRILGDLGHHWLQRHPEAVPLLAGVVQRIRPILKLGSSYLVMRDADVREVLERRDDFELGPVNGPKMLDAIGGPFLLGMDPSADYAAQKQHLAAALRGLGPSFPDIAEQESKAAGEDLLPVGTPTGRRQWIEVVSRYAERVTTRVAARFYGVPWNGARSAVLRGASEEDILRLWLRKLGSVIASPWPAPFGLQRIAGRCRKEFVAHFDVQYAERGELVRAGRTQGGDVLTCLIEAAQQPGSCLGQDAIRHGLTGLMLAGSAALAKSFVHVLDQLLQRPERFAMAVRAAKGNDGKRLGSLAEEAMRFNPTFIVLPRYCPRDTTLAAGTSRRRQIRAGSTLYCVTLAAMFDSEAVPEPEAFRPGRDYAYLHFGTGLHWCLGREVDIARVQLQQMLVHFLRHPRLLHGDATRIRRKRIVYDGPAVDRFWIGLSP